MLLFGHVGAACGLVHALDRRGTADLRVVALASLLSDLVDKPLWLLAPDFCHGWTRTLGHGLGALGVFSLGAAL